MIRTIDHIAIAVWDIDASLPYYTDVLGLSLLEDEMLPSAGVRLAYLQAGNVMIQLVQPIGETAIRKHLEEKGEGLQHICFGVEDIPATLGSLPGEHNVQVKMGGRRRRACFIGAKPNSVPIELTELEPFVTEAKADTAS
ncbi:VOC family protein [Paenibacillus sp. BC26]|uniref:VOC family protein n=1 Tax=Paenibacillus sp. BC26 TaxID=1881032 RepID=UPI0008E6473A|nr:VOC family protein [Paenibacillus sp. BC26]SFS55982.1 methylmalonyl-CoA/ethylmalonyl-CoA epimerase [Paenibacillus sp. BC26]